MWERRWHTARSHPTRRQTFLYFFRYGKSDREGDTGREGARETENNTIKAMRFFAALIAVAAVMT